MRIFIFLSLVIMSGASFAQDSYFGIGLGNTTVRSHTASSTSRNAVGLIGHNFNYNLGIEAEFSTNINKDRIHDSTYFIDYAHTHLAGYLKFSIYPADNTTLFLRAGYGDFTTTGDSSDTSSAVFDTISTRTAIYGVGIQYNFSPNFKFRVDYSEMDLGTCGYCNVKSTGEIVTVTPVIYSF
jgi:hypothetical protein